LAGANTVYLWALIQYLAGVETPLSASPKVASVLTYLLTYDLRSCQMTTTRCRYGCMF